ncbi:hypothetical protein EDD22DRAFT_892178 [Suillus occidentalis]|nr:hypothetical protein EDD22DRAFT_892178 [Suillus occidentalis]
MTRRNFSSHIRLSMGNRHSLHTPVGWLVAVACFVPFLRRILFTFNSTDTSHLWYRWTLLIYLCISSSLVHRTSTSYPAVTQSILYRNGLPLPIVAFPRSWCPIT